MIKIGYNDTSNHIGLKTHLEKPDRVNYVINKLKQKFEKSVFLEKGTYLPINKIECMDLINNVHSTEHVDFLLNPKFPIITCRNCTSKIKNKNMETLVDIVKRNNHVNFAIKICVQIIYWHI